MDEIINQQEQVIIKKPLSKFKQLFSNKKLIIFLIILISLAVFLIIRPRKPKIFYYTPTKYSEPSPSPEVEEKNNERNIIYEGELIIDSTKYVSYTKSEYVFLRKIEDGKLLDEKIIASAKGDIYDYSIDKNFKYIAYAYYENPSTFLSYEKNINDIDKIKNVSFGDSLILKNLENDEKITIFSDLKEDELISGFSFVKNATSLFIILNNEDIYFYDIPSRKLTKSGNSSNRIISCRPPYRFWSIKESPNSENLIILTGCHEGGIDILYNIDSDTFTKIGESYVEGIQTIGFLNDDEIYAHRYRYKDGYRVIDYLKIDLSGNIIEELSKPIYVPAEGSMYGNFSNQGPIDKEESFSSLKYYKLDYNGQSESFLSEKTYSSENNWTKDKDRQTIGIDISNIIFHYIGI